MDFFKQAVENASSKYSNLSVRKIEQLEGRVYVTIDGGLNGRGVLRDYLSDLIDVIDNINEEYSDVWVEDVRIDSLDDVFTLILGVNIY